MARRTQEPALTGAYYRQFAGIVLVFAAGIALYGGSENSAEPAGEPPAAVPAVAASSDNETPPAEEPAGEFFAAEDEPAGLEAFVDDEITDGAEPEPLAADTPPAAAPAPGMPEPKSTVLAERDPTPAQIERLLTASRERSGASDGGD